MSKEENIDFSGHLRRLLHKNVKVEKVLDRRDASKGFQLLSIGLSFLFALPRLYFSLVLTLSRHITSFWLLAEELKR